MPAAKGKDRKMQNETTNLFRRRDTFFGICEAVGQDFGFNPLYLRLAFIAPLFFFPVQTFAAYFALGGIVPLLSFFGYFGSLVLSIWLIFSIWRRK